MAEAGVLELVEVEPIAHLDFPVLCEWEDVGRCEARATWEARAVCCGWIAFACDEHRAALIGCVDEFFCQACGCDPVVVEWAPLGGSRG